MTAEAMNILAMAHYWQDVPWPNIPADIIEAAEEFAKSGERPVFRQPTLRERQTVKQRRRRA